MIGSALANALAIDATRTTKAATVAATLDATMLVDRMAEAEEAAEDVDIAD